jgi:alkylation response protein AidB-like acyl-CoA dehydrogenase
VQAGLNSHANDRRFATLLAPTSPPLVALEAALAEKSRPDGPFAPAALAELDRLEAFPAEACRALDELGLADHYVPTRLGGKLVDHLGSSLMVRAVARRDLTVAIAHAKTFLGAVSVWLAGTESQRMWLAREIRAGRLVAWGLTERDHGSDLFACELAATPHDETWRLDGEKWLINNATRAELACILARTSPRGGPLGFSLFLVDKRGLGSSAYSCLPKVRTHGIRGADISGIRFTAAAVPAGALVGEVGRGLYVVLESLQLTRTVCTVLSLGAADHGMRIAVDFTRGHARSAPRILGEAAALRLLAEATVIFALRGVHAFPEEMSVIAAVAKGFVPTVVDLLLSRLASFLGAVAFVVDPSAHGAFEKLERDHRIVALFDGSTAVCQAALIAQFPTLAEGYGTAAAPDRLASASCLASPPPEFDPAALRLSAPGCTLVAALPELIAELRELTATGELPGRVLALAIALESATAQLHRELGATMPAVRQIPTAHFALARRYELCFAGAACLNLWAHNTAEGGFRSDTTWLEGALVVALSLLGVSVTAEASRSLDELARRAADPGGEAAVSLLGANVGSEA